MARAMDDEAVEKWLEAPESQELQLSTQVLRTCQQLYSEGIEILHCENEVELRLDVRVRRTADEDDEDGDRNDRHGIQFRMSPGGFNAWEFGPPFFLATSLTSVLRHWVWYAKPADLMTMKCPSHDRFYSPVRTRKEAVTCLQKHLSQIRQMSKFRVTITYVSHVDI